MSPNIQDGGTETPSRKRTLKDFLESANAQAAKAAALSTKPATPSKLQLVTAVDNLAALEKEKKQEQKGQAEPTSPTDDLMSIDSPLSEMSDGPLSLLTDDAGSSTPARRSTSPNATPCKSSAGASPQVVITIDATPPPGLSATTTASAQPPAAKRKRLTPSEREEKAKADAARKLEKDKAEAARKLEKEKAELAKKQEKEKKEKAEAAKKQERDEQKAVADAKKKAIAEEKEKKRKQKEDEDRRKNEEKEKKRKEKEAEERKVQEAKDKKERSQLRLNSFFKTPSSSSTSTSAAATSGSLLPGGSSPLKPAAARGSSASPRKPTTLATSITRAAGTSSESETVVAEVSEYDRIFKPFFVKENVIVATDLYGMDDETKEAKSRILDEFLAGSRGDFAPPKPFSATAAVDYFHLPCDPTQTPLRQPARGRSRPTVRKIMNMLGPDAIYGGLQSGLDGANEAQTKLALNVLKSVPMKYLFFREDVRPAYYGTVTSQPPTARLSKLARDPLAKTVLPLNYDYDSEAEWVDDGDGEDVDDLDDDEEELDDDGEMSDFLDDSEDAVPLRPAFSGGMEPESTGVCWENERRKAPKPELDNFRMEFILGMFVPKSWTWLFFAMGSH